MSSNLQTVLWHPLIFKFFAFFFSQGKNFHKLESYYKDFRPHVPSYLMSLFYLHHQDVSTLAMS